MKDLVTLTEDDVRHLLSLACKKLGSQKAFAQTHGLSSAYMSDIINGKRNPSKEICKILGITRSIVYSMSAAQYKRG